MVSMAAKRQRPDVASYNTQKVLQKTSAVVESSKSTTTKRLKNQKAAVVREINTSLLVKISDQPIGAETFGQVYLAEYRGMKTVVKEMKKGAMNLIKKLNVASARFFMRLK